MKEQNFSPRNIIDKIAISTPKFEGLRNLNLKLNRTQKCIENKINILTNNDINPIKKRINNSEKTKKKNFDNNFILNNSIDNKLNLSSIFHNYNKKNIDRALSEKQISFDEKSDNYLFANEIENKNNNDKEDIIINKNVDEIKKEKKLDINENKKENDDDSFNYDLPLEMDKSSEIFNFISSQGKNQEILNNIKEINNLQEYNYNDKFDNIINKDKNLNTILINIKKTDKNLNNNNTDLNDNSAKYFSFDGGMQITEDNKLIKNKDNKEISNDNNNCENAISLEQKNDKDDKHLNVKDGITKNINNGSDLCNNSSKKKYLSKEKDLSNKNDNKKDNNLIITPKKEFKKRFNILLQSEEKIISKGYSIQNDKKLINKNLIGYLAFNTSYSLQSKSSIIYDDSFSEKKIRENSKLSGLYPSKRLIFDNINDSIDKLNKKNNKNNINDKIIKININNKNKSVVEKMNNNSKEISINLKFNNYLNRSRNINIINYKKSFTRNVKVFNFINKDKTLPNKIVNYTHNNLNSFIDLKNYQISKVKNKHSIKYSPKHKKNISSLNINNNSLNNNYYKPRNSGIEYSQISEEINLFKTVNLNNNISNKLLYNKRNNTLKSIPMQKKLDLIKVNKIINNKNSYNKKKELNKYENILISNIYNKLPFANSTKTLKARNKALYSLNLETIDKIDKQLFTHKASKINHINSIKNKIESFKKNNNERFGSYDNYNNCINNSKKQIFNKKIINTKTKISLDKNIKKKLKFIKKNNLIKNNKNKKIYSHNYNNVKNLYIKYNNNQNKYLTSYQNNFLNDFNKEFNKEEIVNYQKKKSIENKNKISNIPFSKKININKGIMKNINNNNNINKIYHSKNKLKKKDYQNYINKNNKKNRINKELSPKSNRYLFNYVEIKPSINIIDQDIIRYSILRNNQNNKVSKVFSVTLGNNDNTNNSKNKNDRLSSIINNNNFNNDDYKKTIINVNQYYPNYYFSTNDLEKTS